MSPFIVKGIWIFFLKKRSSNVALKSLYVVPAWRTAAVFRFDSQVDFPKSQKKTSQYALNSHSFSITQVNTPPLCHTVTSLKQLSFTRNRKLCNLFAKCLIFGLTQYPERFDETVPPSS